MSTPNKVEISQINEVTTVEITTVGPQGPAFDIDLVHTDKVDNSIMYYDATSGKLKLDSTTTKLTLVDGGNF